MLEYFFVWLTSQTDVSDRERDLLHQVSELQARVTTLMDELQNAKLKSVGVQFSKFLTLIVLF
jgi:hypothetical protein